MTTELPPRRQVLRDLLLSRAPAAPPPPAASDPVWAALRAAGTRLWLDTGDLEGARALWCAEMEGLTTNNTLLNAEVQKGLYDDEIPAVGRALLAAEPGLAPAELVREISLYLNARHGLKLAAAFGARVSVELHTDLAHDAAGTVATGSFLHGLSPAHFIVKVPLTAAGILATRLLARAGVPVNHTLGFSARQNLLVAAVARPAWVNVFMGRLNAWVAESGLGDGRNVGERATLASQRELLRLRAEGWPTRQIGASMRDGSQVGALAGLDVFTMPLKVARDWHASRPAAPASCLAGDFPVAFGPGVDKRAAGLPVLWEVSGETREKIRDLAGRVRDESTPAWLEDEARRAGLADLLPGWPPPDEEALRKGGKLPAWARWREEIAAGRKGLDALFTRAGLLSFAADQAALDGRVRRLLPA